MDELRSDKIRENDFSAWMKEGNLMIHFVTRKSVNILRLGCRLGALPIGQHKPRSLQHLRLTIMAVMDEAQMPSVWLQTESFAEILCEFVWQDTRNSQWSVTMFPSIPHPMCLPFHCELRGWSLHCVSAAFNGSSVSPWRPEVLGDGSVAKGESQVGLVDVDSF